MNVFGIDIGGSGIKGAPVDTQSGELLEERVRIKTPKPATPEAIVGTAVAGIGMYLLSTLGTGSSRFESSLYMAILGIGAGMVMQILVLATQNEAPIDDLVSLIEPPSPTIQKVSLQSP